MAIKYLTTKQSAERLGVAVRTMQKWILKGYFPNVVKVDPYADRPNYWIPEPDIEAFEAKRQLTRDVAVFAPKVMAKETRLEYEPPNDR